MTYPLVSIVIPCFNHESFVKDSIQAVIDQNYRNIELIIIDDGSEDGSVQIIQNMINKCKSRFIRFEFRHRPNKGLCTTLNEALQWCEGKYFSVIASDDQMLAHKTTIQVSFLEKNNDVMAVMGSVNLIDSKNKKIKKINLKYKEYTFEDIFLSNQILYACTQMSRLESIILVNGYKENCTIEDWYMWLKLSELGRIVSLQETLVNYRLHDDNTIKKGEEIYSGMTEIINEYKYHPLYFKSLKQIIWIRVAAIIAKDKKLGMVFFKEMFEADKMVIFDKNFYRCIRNLIFK